MLKKKKKNLHRELFGKGIDNANFSSGCQCLAERIGEENEEIKTTYSDTKISVSQWF